MKYILIPSFVLFFSFFSRAQTPLVSIEIQGHSVNSNNYYKITAELDAYWESNPLKNVKGSGFKPYQRWKEYWKNYLHSDGTLMTSDEITKQFRQSRQSFRSITTGKTTATDKSDWQPLGPFSHKNKGSWSSGQGRVNITVVDPSNPNTIFIGSPNGGLWKSTDHGSSWINLTDTLPTIGISGIAVDYANSNIVYISTGDEDGSDSYTSGIYKSLDGGFSWTKLSYPYSPFSLSGEILINPTDSKMLWVVGNNGLYKTIDGGATWTRKLTSTCKEIRLNPKNPNTVFVLERVGTKSSILKSTNAGETFNMIDTFLNSGRTMIDVTKADTSYLYALVTNSDNSFRAIYRTINSGLSFTTQNSTTDVFSYGSSSSRQAYYDLALAVSDQDEDMIFTGCMDVWKSVDGGVTIKKINSWNKPDTTNYTHADIHDMKFYNNKLYVSSDGGIYISDNNGLTFADKTINGLNISQFYRLDVAQSDSVQIAGGLQDNGGYSLSGKEWVNYHGADGMDAAIDPANPSFHYGFIQFGGSLYAHDITMPDKGKYIARSPKGEMGEWITPLEAGNGGLIFAGFKKLYVLIADSFYTVNSDSLASNILQIRVHPYNDYKVLLSDGKKLYVTDGTPTFKWTPFATLPMSGIKNFDFNRTTPSIIYAISDASVYKSTDSGASWKNITYSLPVGAKNAIVHQASSPNNTVYLATANAVYYINDSLTDWQLFSNGIPHTTITDIEVNNVENHVLISTYGRGVWRSPVAPSGLKIESLNKDNSGVFFYPNPVTQTAKLNISINEAAEVKIYNAAGSIVSTLKYARIEAQTEFDFSALPNGIYTIVLTSETHMIAKKILKN